MIGVFLLQLSTHTQTKRPKKKETTKKEAEIISTISHCMNSYSEPAVALRDRRECSRVNLQAFILPPFSFIPLKALNRSEKVLQIAFDKSNRIICRKKMGIKLLKIFRYKQEGLLSFTLGSAARNANLMVLLRKENKNGQCKRV